MSNYDGLMIEFMKNWTSYKADTIDFQSNSEPLLRSRKGKKFRKEIA
ncbi:hypothetical protein NNC19_15525 [Clostridium sp. SHJSY1]|nr:hypothetical protein [Clostridium sp. SHJSY1]MDS0527102.1 hypothetical protein [Clostridium sp. SHJSY1]